MRTKLKKFQKKLIKINPLYSALLACVLGLALKSGITLGIAIGATAYFSWRLMVSDLKERKIHNLDLLGLLVSGCAMEILGANLDVALIRAVVAFLVGWLVFQLFEGDIGGGDVRLVTVLALFLSTTQLFVTVSVASLSGIVIASAFALRRVPFGSLLIIFSWIVYGVIRF